MMVARVVCLLAAAVIAGAGAAHAQRLDASGGGNATVGDTVTITLRVTLPPGAVPAGDPHPRDSLPNSVRLLALDTLPRAADGARRYRARLAFFQVGTLTSPAFAVTFRRAAEEPVDSAVSGAVLVTVTPTLPDTAVAMRDIRAIASLGGSSDRASRWWIIVIAALLAAAAAAVLLRGKRRRLAPHAAVVVRQLGAYDSARQRLDALASSPLPDTDVARFYDEITDALRRYLEAEYDVPAAHRTTPELLAGLPATLRASTAASAALLGEADFVKFARLRPAPDGARGFLARAAALLDEWHAATPAADDHEDREAHAIR